MPIIHSRSWVAAPIEEVFIFFDDPANLARLMPPPVAIRPVRVDPIPPQAGTEIEFRYGIGPIQRRWVVRLLAHESPTRIVDVTVSGPMRRFHHAHMFRRARAGTWIEDRVDYHVGPDGALGAAIDLLAGVLLRLTFTWRHARQRRLLRTGS
jgi:ligand-binding SRPBCC domain-containing protein